MNFEFQIPAPTKQPCLSGAVMLTTHFGFVSKTANSSFLTIRRDTTLFSATHRIPVDATSPKVCEALTKILALVMRDEITEAGVMFVELITSISTFVEKFVQDSAGRCKLFLQSTAGYRGDPFRVLVDVDRT